MATVSAIAQSDRFSGYGVELNPVVGKIIKNNQVFPPVPKLSTAFEVAILKRTDGNKEWQAQRNNPLIGLGITYTSYGIDSVYGKCIGVYPVWELPIVRGEKLEWTCRIGVGIGYVTKHFERSPSWDTLNNLIGSNLNNFTMFTTQLRYKLNNKVHLHTGFNFSHISNGGFQLPNLGLNKYGGHVGLRYFPVTDQPQQRGNRPQQPSRRWMFQARIGIGFVEYNNVDGPRYPVYTATVFASKRYGNNNKLLAGIDYSYFTSVYSFMRNNGIEPGNERAQSWEGVVFIGHEWVIGRIGVIAQLGVPFKHGLINKDKTIQKMGYSYYIIQQEKGLLKELSVNGFIKSNNLEASHIELGLGVGF